MKRSDRELFYIGALLLALALFASIGCSKHMEASSSLASTSTATIDATRTVDTTEPVAVPERLEFRIWTPEPLVPSAGGGALVNLPQTVKPLRRIDAVPIPLAQGVPFTIPDDAVDGRVASGSYVEGTLFFGKPADKVTHAEEGSHAAASGVVNASAKTEKDSKPFGIFAFLAAFWPFIAGAVPVLLIVFRKQLLAILVKLGLKAV